MNSNQFYSSLKKKKTLTNNLQLGCCTQWFGRYILQSFSDAFSSENKNVLINSILTGIHLERTLHITQLFPISFIFPSLNAVIFITISYLYTYYSLGKLIYYFQRHLVVYQIIKQPEKVKDCQIFTYTILYFHLSNPWCKCLLLQLFCESLCIQWKKNWTPLSRNKCPSNR